MGLGLSLQPYSVSLENAEKGQGEEVEGKCKTTLNCQSQDQQKDDNVFRVSRFCFYFVLGDKVVHVCAHLRVCAQGDGEQRKWGKGRDPVSVPKRFFVFQTNYNNIAIPRQPIKFKKCKRKINTLSSFYLCYMQMLKNCENRAPSSTLLQIFINKYPTRIAFILNFHILHMCKLRISVL